MKLPTGALFFFIFEMGEVDLPRHLGKRKKEEFLKFLRGGGFSSLLKILIKRLNFPIIFNNIQKV